MHSVVIQIFLFQNVLLENVIPARKRMGSRIVSWFYIVHIKMIFLITVYIPKRRESRLRMKQVHLQMGALLKGSSALSWSRLAFLQPPLHVLLMYSIVLCISLSLEMLILFFLFLPSSHILNTFINLVPNDKTKRNLEISSNLLSPAATIK